MKNVLVTGGAGFIGSNFIHYLRRVEAGIRIINLDALTYAGNLGNLAKLAAAGDYIFIQGDICNETLIDQMGRGIARLDAGTHSMLLQAANFIQAVEERQGLKIGYPEEIAYRMGFFDRHHL
jgi:dTDP-D-glucose 4,6-dehydratase